MTFLVTDACVRCKFMDCVTVCPVTCFHEGEHLLVIDPDECIDCGLCEPECPAAAIIPDSKDGTGRWMEINRHYSSIWPGIFEKGVPPADARDHMEEKNKFERYIHG